MAEFSQKLKEFRERQRKFKNSTEFYKALGSSQPTGSRYESGDTEPDLSFLNKLLEVFGDEARPLMPGWGKVAPSLAEPSPGYVTGVLPEHVSVAWAILHEAVERAGADIMRLDVAAVGEMLGAAAEAVAQGRGEEARLRAVRRAEVVLRAMGKAAP